MVLDHTHILDREVVPAQEVVLVLQAVILTIVMDLIKS